MYNEVVINEIKDWFIKNEKTISVAESVTSGHLQAAISLAVDASQFYQGGITVYNASQKARHLNIEPIYAEKVNSVSDKVARELALNVRKMFLSDYGVGITGYASIVPQCEEEGLFAFFAISYKEDIALSGKIKSNKSNTLDAQMDYMNQVITALHNLVTHKR